MNKLCNNRITYFRSIQSRGPDAYAKIAGNCDYPDLYGNIYFYRTRFGVLVTSHVFGLPCDINDCAQGIFGFHIHSGCSCTGDINDPFSDAEGHYNPNGCEHPHHAGDLPPLFSSGGYSYSQFLTDRFTIKEIIGKTVIIHLYPDDFTSQPSGNAGEKIACGIINKTLSTY